MIKRYQNLLVAIVAVAAALGGFLISEKLGDGDTTNETASGTIQGFVLDTPRRLGIPELQRDDGSVFDRADLEGQWSLLFYGYTNCPDICPTTLSTVAAAKQRAESFPQVVFVSVDPARDDVKLVGDYARYFDNEFVGVTGEEKLLQAMATQMSVVAMAMPAEDGSENYLVDHSSNLLLVDPEVRLVAMLRPPHSVDSINRAIGEMVKNEK